MDKISTKFSGLNIAQKLRAHAGRGGNQVSESPRPASRPGIGVSHPSLPGTLISPDKAIGKWFVIPLCQRASGEEAGGWGQTGWWVGRTTLRAKNTAGGSVRQA